MFQELIKKTQDDIENWDWEKKKKELKAHYYKYRYQYAIATILIFIIVLIEEQNIPPIMIGGNKEGGNNTSKPGGKPGGEPKVKNLTDGPNDKKPGGEPKDKNLTDGPKPPEKTNKETTQNKKTKSDAKGASGENAVVDSDKGKSSKGMGKGFNISSMKGPFSDGIKGFGGGVYSMIQRIMKIIGYIFLAAFIVVIPALIYLVLVYLMFKLIVKGSIKM